MTAQQQHSWVLSPFDYRSHLVADAGDEKVLILETRCGERLPSAAGIDPVPRGAECQSCVTEVMRPEFAAPESSDDGEHDA